MDAPQLEWARRWCETPKTLFIDGEWVRARTGLTSQLTNPANGQTLTSFADGSAADVEDAVRAAEGAFHSVTWNQLSRKDRMRTLQKIGATIRAHHAELATLESLNNGKTYREAFYDDIPEAADIFDYYAGWTDKFYGESSPVEGSFVNFTRREPLGVCALVVPWNFPLLLACWKLAPALAMGNTVVLKPSPFTPLSVIRLFEILDEAKVLPRGVINLITGGAESGKALAAHPRIAKISFTGSTEVGKQIAIGASHSNLKAVSLELGGKSPNIIFDDVKDLPSVIDRSFAAMFSHKGEKCSEPTRFFLHESIYAVFAESLIRKANAVVCGDPFHPETHQGPQCHEAHMEKILGYIRSGKEEGAKLLAGGERDVAGSNRKGFFVRPTIFGDVKSSMKIAREEIFGPVLALISFSNEAEVIAEANDSIYGLAAGVYSADGSRALRVANQLQAGQVFINHYGCYDFSAPFGGWKQSGWGQEMAIHSLSSYTRLKSVWIKY